LRYGFLRLPHCVSKIGLKDEFWQICLDQESRAKTAFTIPNRPLYQFKRMPFSLTNAPQTMCRLMDLVIPYQLKLNVLVYLDDLLVLSNSFEDHLLYLSEVATQLRKAGLTINPHVCAGETICNTCVWTRVVLFSHTGETLVFSEMPACRCGGRGRFWERPL